MEATDSFETLVTFNDDDTGRLFVQNFGNHLSDFRKLYLSNDLRSLHPYLKLKEDQVSRQ
jgi:hypothetical protein